MQELLKELKMQFRPNFDLLRDWESAEKAKDFACNSAFVSVFKRDGKTLVYMCDRHGENISFNMVDMCFSDDFGIRPDVLLVEMENENFERKFDWYWLQNNTLSYAAAVASEKNVPIVFADLSDTQMIEVINCGFPNNKISESADLSKVLSHEPNINGNLYQQMCEYLGMAGRDKFMLQNIAVALNKYDTVFCIFGVGHYEKQRLVLEDMMGEPEYITRIKNMRDDYSNVKIDPIKLCDFEIGGANDKNA